MPPLAGFQNIFNLSRGYAAAQLHPGLPYVAPGRGSRIPFAALTSMNPTNGYLWGYQLKTLTELNFISQITQQAVVSCETTACFYEHRPAFR